jgi:hypothetical protein
MGQKSRENIGPNLDLFVAGTDSPSEHHHTSDGPV